ncbi:hypothetical protein B0H34DRAFT_863475 [Crassisporium funariophilum]|nr:hypothetical protein B0H34DRAFT_863475 [Crassisporium funariophilum]
MNDLGLDDALETSFNSIRHALKDELANAEYDGDGEEGKGTGGGTVGFGRAKTTTEGVPHTHSRVQQHTGLSMRHAKTLPNPPGHAPKHAKEKGKEEPEIPNELKDDVAEEEMEQIYQPTSDVVVHVHGVPAHSRHVRPHREPILRVRARADLALQRALRDAHPRPRMAHHPQRMLALPRPRSELDPIIQLRPPHPVHPRTAPHHRPLVPLLPPPPPPHNPPHPPPLRPSTPLAPSSSPTPSAPLGESALSQSYYYALIAAILYGTISTLLLLNLLGASARVHAYPPSFAALTIPQRTLMLQTISFSLYLALGASLFSALEGWAWTDGVYWADYTLLTVGLGTDFPLRRAGSRGLLIPGLVLERGKVKVVRRGLGKERERWMEVVRRRREELVRGKEVKEDSGNKLQVIPVELAVNTLEGEEVDPWPRAEFELMRYLQSHSERRAKYRTLFISVLVFLLVWVGGSVVFWATEKVTQGWTFTEALYFTYTTLLTIGYGDFYPTSSAGKPFFVVWSLISVPAMTVLISNMGDTVVRGVQDATVWVGKRTVLPERGGGGGGGKKGNGGRGGKKKKGAGSRKEKEGESEDEDVWKKGIVKRSTAKAKRVLGAPLARRKVKVASNSTEKDEGRVEVEAMASCTLASSTTAVDVDVEVDPPSPSHSRAKPKSKSNVNATSKAGENENDMQHNRLAIPQRTPTRNKNQHRDQKQPQPQAQSFPRDANANDNNNNNEPPGPSAQREQSDEHALAYDAPNAVLGASSAFGSSNSSRTSIASHSPLPFSRTPSPSPSPHHTNTPPPHTHTPPPQTQTHSSLPRDVEHLGASIQALEQAQGRGGSLAARLAREIGRLARDVGRKPGVRYEWEEWEGWLGMLGEGEGEGGEKVGEGKVGEGGKKAAELETHDAQKEKDTNANATDPPTQPPTQPPTRPPSPPYRFQQHAHALEKEEAAWGFRWTWLADGGPLFSAETETEWVLGRLCGRLEEVLEEEAREAGAARGRTGTAGTEAEGQEGRCERCGRGKGEGEGGRGWIDWFGLGLGLV